MWLSPEDVAQNSTETDKESQILLKENCKTSVGWMQLVKFGVNRFY